MPLLIRRYADLMLLMLLLPLISRQHAFTRACAQPRPRFTLYAARAARRCAHVAMLMPSTPATLFDAIVDFFFAAMRHAFQPLFSHAAA